MSVICDAERPLLWYWYVGWIEGGSHCRYLTQLVIIQAGENESLG